MNKTSEEVYHEDEYSDSDYEEVPPSSSSYTGGDPDRRYIKKRKYVFAKDKIKKSKSK